MEEWEAMHINEHKSRQTIEQLILQDTKIISLEHSSQQIHSIPRFSLSLNSRMQLKQLNNEDTNAQFQN